jgi:NagD protein
MNDVNPDYVIIGETRNYNYQNILKAVKLINQGAKLIGTNPDLTGPSEDGMIPACRALVAPIELTTGKYAYYVGKPNPFMMRNGKRILDCRTLETAIIGDRMDTDIIAGIEAEMDTILVLSGVSSRETVKSFSYNPKYIFDDIGFVKKFEQQYNK